MGAEPLKEPPLLACRGLACGAPGTGGAVLRDIRLELPTGACAVLLGANGAGKSTLLRTLAGVWPPLAGRILLEGEEPAPGFDATRAGLILEEPALQFVALTVRGELEFALECAGLSGGPLRRRVEAGLEAFALASLAGRDPSTLSAGEQQRVLLAAALITTPRVLLLDDPFLYLSPSDGRAAWERIREAVASGAVGGALVATQDVELALYADCLGVLADGGLQGWGPPEAVLRDALPPSVDPPLGLLLERRMAELGRPLPVGGLTPEAAGGRIAGAVK